MNLYESSGHHPMSSASHHSLRRTSRACFCSSCCCRAFFFFRCAFLRSSISRWYLPQDAGHNWSQYVAMDSSLESVILSWCLLPWDSPSPVGRTQCWNTLDSEWQCCSSMLQPLPKLNWLHLHHQGADAYPTPGIQPEPDHWPDKHILVKHRETMAVGTKCLPCPRLKKASNRGSLTNEAHVVNYTSQHGLWTSRNRRIVVATFKQSISNNVLNPMERHPPISP